MIRIALCQMMVGEEKEKNVKKAVKMIGKAADKGTDIVVLPEMFNCPYDNALFEKYAESYDNSPTLKEISYSSKKYGVSVAAGSIPELDDEKIYNTCFVFGPDGKLAARHRKMHLFDVDVEGGIKFTESDALSKGNEITTADLPCCKTGIGICYDIRFPEYSRLVSLAGAKIMIVPAAFNMTTGPAHWEMTIRTRALDNQMYVAACAPARNKNSSYISYANSMAAGPWGNVAANAGVDECMLYIEIDLKEIDRIRGQLPLLKHLRTDVYTVKKV